jgi:hypothetical protein
VALWKCKRGSSHAWQWACGTVLGSGTWQREEAIAAIDTERTLPDVLSFDPSKPAQYPNGRIFTDDVINYRLAFLTKNECPPTGLNPHTDTLKEFPYIGTPHVKRAAA